MKKSVNKKLVICILICVLLSLSVIVLFSFQKANSFENAYDNGNIHKQVSYAFSENKFFKNGFDVKSKSNIVGYENCENTNIEIDNYNITYYNSNNLFARIENVISTNKYDKIVFQIMFYDGYLRISACNSSNDEKFDYVSYTDMDYVAFDDDDYRMLFKAFLQENESQLERIYNECEIDQEYIKLVVDDFFSITNEIMSDFYSQL